MSTVHTEAPVTPRRRVPTQERSRRRVEEILDAAAGYVVEHGVDSLTTREIAREAGIPVASLYQYFADKEAVLLAIVERDTAEMDEQVAADLADLAETGAVSIPGIVHATVAAFVKVYGRRPAFVEIYLRGRTSAVVEQYGREHNARIARSLRDFVVESGLARPELTETMVELAVEVGDRVFQLAYEHVPGGDATILQEGTDMIVAYLAPYATAAGRGPREGES